MAENEDEFKSSAEIRNAIIDLLKKEHACSQVEIERRLPYLWYSIKDARIELANKHIIRHRKLSFHPEARETIFYFLPEDDTAEILETISKKTKLMAKLTDNSFTIPLGKVGIDVAIRTLKDFGFIICGREILFFNDVRLSQQEDGDLDIIAFKNKFYGFEVKNRKMELTIEEYDRHIKRCKKVDLLPAFIVTGATKDTKEKAKADKVPLIIVKKQFVKHTPENLTLVMAAKTTLGDDSFVLVGENEIPNELKSAVFEKIGYFNLKH